MDESNGLLLARAVEVAIGDEFIRAAAKVFATGSRGWYHSGKVVINGQRCQVTLSAVIVGSKKWNDLKPETTNQIPEKSPTIAPDATEGPPVVFNPPTPAEPPAAKPKGKRRQKQPLWRRGVVQTEFADE
jgi:hypothetical protein